MVRELPKQFEDFGEARQKGFLKVKNIKDNGGKVAGVFCTFTPLEILDAAGFTPVSLCGMSGETIPAAEAHLPKNLCPLIKSSYGFAVSDKCPYTYFSDIIVGETTCDGKKKMYELLNEIRPTYILHLPQGERENALDGAGFIFDPADRVSMLTNLYNDVAAAYASGARPVSEGDKRILITGCPIGGVMNKTVKTIEENGGAVVCFENCTGIKAAYQLVDTEADDVMAAIAKRYLSIGCAVMTPNSVRVELLKRLISEYKIDGVVEIDLQSCTPYTIETHFIRREMEKLGIHYIALETDYSQSDSGQLSTRLEAFLEML